jgi:hypothetical protein
LSSIARFWENKNLEEFSKELANSFKGDEGRLRRMLSALATCTTVEEAKAVIAFHYHRSKSQEVKRVLGQLFKELGDIDNEKFREKVVPRLRALYNFTIYYTV